MITDSLFYLTLCEHQSVLADNSVCIHNRMLSDDVLSCSGVLAWNRGNLFLYFNRQYDNGTNPSYIIDTSKANILIAIYQCIYTRGQWKRACGESVDE